MSASQKKILGRRIHVCTDVDCKNDPQIRVALEKALTKVNPLEVQLEEAGCNVGFC